ncbi:MAG: hypothetical protein ACKV2U_23330 [Bryobacteraceae bacterium]
MSVVEFEGTVAPGGHVALPPEIASEIPAGEHIRIVVMWDAGDAGGAWRTVSRRRFEAAYAPEDAVYEQLIDDAAIR